MKSWQCGRFLLDLSQPKIMGIVNMTPDSFSDGGRYSYHFQAALSHAYQLIDDGADFLDIGGESTRPNAPFVSPEEEWLRIERLLHELKNSPVPITLDTRRTSIMHKAISENLCDAINDINALQDEGALDLLSQYPKIGVCLMHMQGLPENMQNKPSYQNVATSVQRFLQERFTACVNAGIDSSRIILDPGIGFGKTVEHNLELLRNPNAWQITANRPYLIGLSRKSFLGALIDENNAEKRVHASVMAAIESIRLGASIVRVHDVKATRDALKIYQAFQA